MQEQTSPTGKRRFPMGWCFFAILAISLAGMFAARQTIQIKYHTIVLNWSVGEFFSGMTGKPQSVIGRAFSPRQVSDMMDHHKAKLVELGAMQHRLYFFPRIEPTTEANQWLSREFRDAQPRLGTLSSSSGGTRDKVTGESVRSIEIWLDPAADVTLWDDWKASIDATDLEMMRIEAED